MSAEAGRPLVVPERRGRTLLLTIDHPPVNVLSASVLRALSEALDRAAEDRAVHAVVLASAQEKAFAAGADIREMHRLDPRGAHDHGARGQGLTRQIETLPLPVIAAVHGVCLGGGCEVVLACDFVVASEDAKFGQPEINLGVMPGWGGTRRLPRRIGLRAARRWILTGASVPAAEAHAAGLVDQVVPRAALLPAALALADELASKPPVAVAAAKFALLNAVDPSIDEGLAYELKLWSELFGTEGQVAGMTAFLEKKGVPVLQRDRWDEESAPFPWSGRSASRGEGKGDKRQSPPSA